MIEKTNVGLLADFITLVYHEARNVRHLIEKGCLDSTGLEKLQSLPKKTVPRMERITIYSYPSSKSTNC